VNVAAVVATVGGEEVNVVVLQTEDSGMRYIYIYIYIYI
jgi:hypothetical protein